MKAKLQIIKVWVEHTHDADPDTSHLGKFSDTYSGCEQAIIRFGPHVGKYCSEVKHIDLPEKCREDRFFIPAMSSDETGNPESPKQDWHRLETLNSGDWHYIGIIAKAEVRNPETDVVQVIHSGGLWGIESDSYQDYITEIECDEFAGLTAELKTLGFGERAIKYAIASQSV